MIIEDKRRDKRDETNIKDIPSGTLIRYTTTMLQGHLYWGILIRDIDGVNTIIYDIEDGCYFEDIDENLSEYIIFERLEGKIIIE